MYDDSLRRFIALCVKRLMHVTFSFCRVVGSNLVLLSSSSSFFFFLEGGGGSKI